MCNVPTIDMTGTGRNIVKLRQNAGFSVKDLQDIFGFATRSEERRVGKECRSRWSPYH